jgi:uncharacterized protein (TIGR02270 family)
VSTSKVLAPGVLMRPAVMPVLMQHAEEAAMLRHVRSVLVRAPHVRLLQLGRLDERIAAHLDGLLVAGPPGVELARAQLERGGAGEVFACAWLALASGQTQGLEALADLAVLSAEARRGLVSALGWSEPRQLRGVAAAWLASASATRRMLGLEACRLHRVHPGTRLAASMTSPDIDEAQAALRLAGELGLVDQLPAVRAAAAQREQPALAATAWRQACLLGDAGPAAAALWGGDDAAWPLALQAAPFADGRAWVKALAARPGPPRVARRRQIQACGVLGDAAAVPWLIECMHDLADARVAGEAFSLITGADLAAQDLERKPPAPEADGRSAGGAGPSERAEDEDVALDDDESLPWPDEVRVQAWWQANRARLPAGQRLFLGAPPSLELAQQVLLEGSQRQRALAAQWACRLAPGRPLFAIGAPAGRQRRLLVSTPNVRHAG